MYKDQENFPNKQFNKDAGRIKWNDKADVSYLKHLQTRDNEESLELSKLISPIARRAQSMLFFAENEFNPIPSPKQASPHTYTKMHNQRKLNNTVQKKVSSFSPCSSYSKSLINTTDSNFAIQSQPNQLYVDRSYYFSSQQTDYNSIVNSKQADKQIAALKVVKVMQKINPETYIKRRFLILVKEKSQHSLSNELQSFQSRQLQYMDMLYLSADDNNNYNQRHYNKSFYDRKVENIKIPYYNKLVGLCSPQLITKQILKTTDKNIEEIKTQREQIKKIQTPSKNENSFVFNFDITPMPVVDCEKRIVKDTYSSLKFSSERKKMTGMRMY